MLLMLASGQLGRPKVGASSPLLTFESMAPMRLIHLGPGGPSVAAACLWEDLMTGACLKMLQKVRGRGVRGGCFAGLRNG